MRNLIAFVHISLDGFVAGPNGEMNWIKFDEELFDFISNRISKTDTALYGRNTYQMMEDYWPGAASKPAPTKHDIDHSKWYSQAHKLVLSTTMKDAVLPDTTIISEDVASRINEIKKQGETEILVFGSPTATHSLIQLNLIDGYWLFVNPVVLGHGIPLFADIRDKIKLKLLSTQQFASGVTQLNYAVDK